MGVRRRIWWVTGGALLIAVSGCSAGEPTADSAASSADDTAPISAEDALTRTETSVTPGSRPVPTVPGSTIPGGAESTDPGVVNASPTIAPAPPPPIDPDAPLTTPAPPTTELLSDPQPDPNTTLPPLPTTIEPPASACSRLDDFGIAGIVTDAGGSEADVQEVSNDICRYRSGSIVAEVHFVPESIVADDWYRREGIQPVGDVSGDAVGFGSFMAPGADTSDGFTIAMIGGRQGLIVAVRGTSDARLVAANVAVFANQAA